MTKPDMRLSQLWL